MNCNLLQRELPGQFVAEAAYVASRSYDLTTDYNNNAVPRQYLSTSAVRDTATVNFLSANVPNPFAGLLPGEGLNSATTQRQQLLRPYPQFGNIDTRRYDGSSSYDSAQFRLAGVRHQRLLLPRRGRADQRRGRPGQTAGRPADSAGEQHPRATDPDGWPAWTRNIQIGMKFLF